MPLAELFLVFAQYAWYVVEFGNLPAQRLVDVDVTRGAGNPLLTAQDMCNAHQVIVDDVRQVIGGQSIGFEYDEIVDVGVVESDITMQLVMHDGLALKRDGETYRRPDARRLVLGALLRRQVSAVAIIARGPFLRLLRLAHLLQSLRRAVAVVGMARLDQLIGVVQVKRFALRLVVGAIGATNDRSLIIIHAQPF